MVTSHYGKRYHLEFLRKNAHITREGVSMLGISEAAKEIGFEAFSAKASPDELMQNTGLFPCILHWNQNHFVVLRKITRNIFTGKKSYHLADPAYGMIRVGEEQFGGSWLYKEKGVVLFLNPTKAFHQREPPKKNGISIRYLFEYLSPYKKQLGIVSVLLFLGSCLTLVFPFLTEALIDRGVNAKDMNFIFIILLAQLGVFLGSLVMGIIRNWVMLYMGTLLSISIISDFLGKMLQLPIRFFDTKLMGDFTQRIQDNDRIEEFLTSQSLTTFFSIVTFSVFFGVLWYYDLNILIAYTLLTAVSIGWSLYWLGKRKILDYYRFQQKSENQESIYEMLNGVTEMKLNQFEDFKREEWENIQRRLFRVNIRILKLDQIQLSGFNFLNQLKNILVTFLAATYVVQGQMTLGALLSISYIIGQMNSPVNQLIDFFRSLQDAKLSLERLNEVQNHQTEEQPGQKQFLPHADFRENGLRRGINLKGLSFQYEGPKSPHVLRDIDMLIPDGKITAIVGASGSGKTTLMKLLLRFYDPVDGRIYFNGDDILGLSPRSIRSNTGVVAQDGYIFSDTIERNIATGHREVDTEKLERAVRIANIREFVDSLPLGFKTKIGSAGSGLSGGQRQRILIARAVYKNPHYIFFDEATSALDAENEKIIHDNLQEFFRGKTVLIIAHRLSTVKNADQIIVLKKGRIVERGSHRQLVLEKADYYNLVKNQLELGN